jgi:hypothetical protein
MRALAALFCLALPIVAHTQTTSPNNQTALTTTGAFFALSVADLRQDTNGIATGSHSASSCRPPADTIRAAVTVLQDGGLTVELGG